MSAPRPVRWGFLGAGFIASHALGPAVHAADGAVLHAVGARDPGRAQALEPVGPIGSYADACTNQDVDAVYIALANDDHLRWVRFALECGKHVLCEKPLGLDAQEVAVMTADAQDRGLLLVEAAWNRWHPRTRRFEELIADVTGPRDVRSWFTFPAVPADNYRLDPTRGGGALLDVGCYTTSAVLSALDADEVSVERVDRHVGPTGVDLTTTAVLTHANGSGRITASFEQPESQGVVVTAPGMSVEFSGEAFTTWHQPCALHIVEGGQWREETFAACDPYRLMVEAVSARIRGEDSWVLPLSTSALVATTLDQISATPTSDA